MQRDRPVLWMAVRGSCCNSTQIQRGLEARMRECISYKMLVELDRSMDLLLGSIAYMTW